MLGNESLKKLFATAVNAAICAVAKIMEVYQSGNLRIKAKSDLMPITLADTAAHDETNDNLQSY
jgi:3'-phosphoadenosine 5'-phosphosulfate (PAPS) 3'-phosphatase